MCALTNGWANSLHAGDLRRPLRSLWHHCNGVSLSNRKFSCVLSIAWQILSLNWIGMAPVWWIWYTFYDIFFYFIIRSCVLMNLGKTWYWKVKVKVRWAVLLPCRDDCDTMPLWRHSVWIRVWTPHNVWMRCEHLSTKLNRIKGYSQQCSTFPLTSGACVVIILISFRLSPSALSQLHINIPLAMMTPSNGNIFRVTGHLCGKFTGHRWISHTKASDAELWCLLWSAPERTVE